MSYDPPARGTAGELAFMTTRSDHSISPIRVAASVLLRAVLLFAFWLALVGRDSLDVGRANIGVGAVASFFGAWASLRLLPPSGRAVRPLSLLQLAFRFARQSVTAGLDIALRALGPTVRLRPGTIAFRSGLPSPTSTQFFAGFTSLVPGTLPLETHADGIILYHCLDLDQPNATSLAADHALVRHALGGDSPRGGSKPGGPERDGPLPHSP